MATYTEHYGLHQWESTDDFLRTDFNTDFQKIDTALGTLAEEVAGKCAFVAGSYVGDGAESRSFDLGFQPSVLFVEYHNGYRGGGNVYGGMAMPGLDVHDGALVVTETGFTVTDDRKYHLLNGGGEGYYYLAFR